ncbi:MAG: DUF4251 domain-containing protein [Puia sp.]|nr:DUF4251 domain-containing protein [Puia sp.]
MKAFVILLFGLALLAWHPPVMGQDSKKAQKAARITALVDSQTYVFKAQTATPLSGQLRQLTYGYDLTVTPGSVVSYLPYFGRAYTAPVNPSENGIEFTSKDFEYTKTPRAKGGWDITIKPKDVRNVQQMILTIFDNGSGTLQVLSTSRSQISFNGNITSIKKK